MNRIRILQISRNIRGSLMICLLITIILSALHPERETLGFWVLVAAIALGVITNYTDAAVYTLSRRLWQLGKPGINEWLNWSTNLVICFVFLWSTKPYSQDTQVVGLIRLSLFMGMPYLLWQTIDRMMKLRESGAFKLSDDK